MTSCPEFQNLIDRNDELDPRQKQALDTHLGSCGDCTGYKADADRTLKLLRSLQKHPAPVDSTAQAFDSLSSRLAASKRQMVWALALVALCIAAPFAMLLRGGLSSKIGILMAATLAGSAIALWQIRRGQSSMLRLTERAGGFYATW